MYKNLRCCIIFGFFFTVIVGTLLHFAYDWSNHAFLVSLIAPVNESTWEHMKLLFFPMLLFSIFCISKQKSSYQNIVSGLFAGLLLGTFLIPIFFYTYTGILGFDVFWLDIAVFILSSFFAFTSAYRLIQSGKLKNCTYLLIGLVIILTICFFLFTYFPPKIGLFKNPV